MQSGGVDGLGLGAARALGVLAALVGAYFEAFEAWQRAEARLRGMPADLAGEREPIQPRDLALALDPPWVLRWQAANQRADSLPELQREVWRRGTHQLADIFDRHLAPLAQAIGMLGLAHFCGTASSRPSSCAWTETEIALWSPITHPWL
jgi:hypothetical protein